MPRIRIDTSELTYPWFWLPDHLPRFVDGSAPGGVEVDLAPGEYAVEQTRSHASDLRFVVTSDGTVEVAVQDAHLLRGGGTATLHVVGLPVTLDPAGGSGPLLPMWGGCREPIARRARTVRMPPGGAYALRIGQVPNRFVEFSVGADGVVDYGPEYEGSLSGRGTPHLRVSGQQTPT